MKYIFYSIFVGVFCFSAYQSAEKKLKQSRNFDFIRSGISLTDLEKKIGRPLSSFQNENIYSLKDGSELKVTFHEGKILKANLKFNQLIQIEDPRVKGLTLVQIQADPYEAQNTSWFYAGDPAQGMIYKISSKGHVESISWLPPFQYNNGHHPKQLQALLQDFKTQIRL